MQKTQTILGTVQIGILLLALATAVIHIALAIPANLTMFYLNGIGYIVLALALFLPQLKNYRSLIRWVLIAFTLATIIGWVAVGERNTIAYIDKIIEVALLVLLWLDRGR
jgi:Na+/alanine symporter